MKLSGTQSGWAVSNTQQCCLVPAVPACPLHPIAAPCLITDGKRRVGEFELHSLHQIDRMKLSTVSFGGEECDFMLTGCILLMSCRSWGCWIRNGHKEKETMQIGSFKNSLQCHGGKLVPDFFLSAYVQFLTFINDLEGLCSV